MYASCFDANAGLFEVLLGEKDAVFSDQLNHASIIDGIRLSKTRKFRYRHKGELVYQHEHKLVLESRNVLQYMERIFIHVLSIILPQEC